MTAPLEEAGRSPEDVLVVQPRRAHWHEHMSLWAIVGMLVASLGLATGAAVVDGAVVMAPGVWLVAAVLAAGYRFGPRGVVPVAAASAAVLVRWPETSLHGVRDFGVVAAAYLAFGLMTSAAFHFLFRRLEREHNLRIADVESERNLALALVREREQLQRQLAHSATHDPLTGLPNRSLLVQRIEAALQGARRLRHRCGVMFVDLDDFKSVNDDLGHAAGDHLLKIVALRLEHTVREEDTIARLGGDEFAVLFVDLPAAAASTVVRRVLDAVNSPVTIDDRVVEVRASAGLALSDGDDEALGLLGKADMAMYAVKGRGKGDVAVYEATMHAQVQARRRLEEDLQRAVPENQLRLVYQPIIDLADGRLVGFEALVRWQHPELGMVRPDEFIPLAEATGAIVPIGRWVLEQACRQLRAWQHIRPCEPPLTMAVNISARQLEEPRVAEQLRRAITRTGVDPRDVVLEITESLAMDDDDDAALSVLWQLKALGVRLAIDDFGTGYSSLSRLSRLPIDKLKIDKSFVMALTGPEGRAAATLIRASVAMAQGLGLAVVAEGVEGAEHVSLLRYIGCDQGQGYLFGRPAAAEEFEVARLGWMLTEPDGSLLEQGAEVLLEPAALRVLPSARPRTEHVARFPGLSALDTPSGVPARGETYAGPERRAHGLESATG